MVDEVVTEVMAVHGSKVWTRENGAAREVDVDLDVTLRSADPVVPDVRVTESDLDQNIQLVIGHSSMELWWKDAVDAVARVEELGAVLHAVAAGHYREDVVEVAYGRVVHGQLDLHGGVVCLETQFPS
jgi:hypothetical protein